MPVKPTILSANGIVQDLRHQKGAHEDYPPVAQDEVIDQEEEGEQQKIYVKLGKRH